MPNVGPSRTLASVRIARRFQCRSRPSLQAPQPVPWPCVACRMPPGGDGQLSSWSAVERRQTKCRKLSRQAAVAVRQREREERESKSVVDRARPSVSSGTSPRNGPGSSMWKPVRILRLRASSWRRCVRPPRRTLIKAYGTDTPVPANVRRQLVPSARRVE